LPSFDELGQPCTELHEAKSFLRNELDVDAESAWPPCSAFLC